MGVLKGPTDDRGYQQVVYYKQRATTTYDKDKVISILGIEECMKYGLLKVNDAAVARYLKQHPEIKIEGTKAYSAPFIAARMTNGRLH